jgi:peptidyl-prolyl cis-trans isomerase A (cyclophilin A)
MRQLVLCLALTSCVSAGEHQAVVSERDVLKDRVTELEASNRDLEKRAASLSKEVERLSGAAALRAERKARAGKFKESLEMAADAPLGAVFHTSVGDITCELWPEIAPITVENFVGLATGTKAWTDPKTEQKREDPLYSGTIFHRVIKGFMIQGGDPLGTGRGGPGYRFEDEFDPTVRFSEPGLLAMANAGRNTNGSQFFITDSAPAHLNDKHTIFGKCDLPVMRKIINAPVKGSGRGASEPVEPVVLQSVEITKG